MYCWTLHFDSSLSDLDFDSEEKSFVFIFLANFLTYVDEMGMLAQPAGLFKLMLHLFYMI